MSNDQRRAILERRARFVAMALASAGLAGSTANCGGDSTSDPTNVTGGTAGTGGTPQTCLSGGAGGYGGSGGTPQTCLSGGAGGYGGTPEPCLSGAGGMGGYEQDGSLDVEVDADAPDDSAIDGLEPDSGDADTTDG